MHSHYLDSLKEARITDGEPKTKLLEFTDDQKYAIFDLDLNAKKPVLNRGIHNGINVSIVSTSTIGDSMKYDFIGAIGQNSEVIR